MDNLLGFIFKAVSVEPRYSKDLCLAAGTAVPCRACADVCPHEAISVGRGIEINEVDCSGCGLCVHACPTGALEVRPSVQKGVSLRCSKVKGEAASVLCLGRLEASELLKIIGTRDSVTLAHGDCLSCPIGGAAVLDAVSQSVEDARQLAALHGREIGFEVVQTDRFDETGTTSAVSRRELLRGGWRSLKERTGDLLAPLDPGEDDPDLPTEMQRRYRVIEASKPEPDGLVPWVLPDVAQNCIMCPLCTRACPTGAIERSYEKGQAGVLTLKPEICMGCGACMDACPVDAISMNDEVSWQRLSGGEQVVHEGGRTSGAQGSIAREG